MPKSNTIKHIVTPELMQACDQAVEQHETGKQRLKDKIASAESHVAPDGTADVTNAAAQAGRSLLRWKFIDMLQKLNPNLMYEQSKAYPQFGGIYLDDHRTDPVTMLPVGKHQLCGIPHEAVSEFDVRIVLNEEVPDPATPLNWVTVPKIDGHIPGWRSTLLKLVKWNIVNLTEAEKLFKINEGRSSQNWQMALN